MFPTSDVVLTPAPPESSDRPLVASLLTRLRERGAEDLQYVALHPQPGCVEGDCFSNVLQLIEAQGGEMITGWCIWEVPGFFARAEHHALWRKPDGSTIDPTGREENYETVLFIRDEGAWWAGPGHLARRSFWVVDERNSVAVMVVNKLAADEKQLENSFYSTSD